MGLNVELWIIVKVGAITKGLVAILLVVWCVFGIVEDVVEWQIDLRLTVGKVLVAYDAQEAGKFLQELRRQGAKTRVFDRAAA